MTRTYTSPLSQQDMDLLEGMSLRANNHGQREGHVPLYLAVDTGNVYHQNGWLFICWPALNRNSAHCARLIFDFIGDVVKAQFGAEMVATFPSEETHDSNK
jgi:hypothetical protein